ncbi:hypothetical protein A3C89_04205 [Candidatus Kaiserbacteria bacterium RIFCSPHIGHO2_02_FULL_50_50]|uniref:Uncharacterized protein n=1 Tax=Candidatus Kaiserbacteria bacterium RIFCSPHIGHO2_02_FULL_50_50 TaxID=1798492 RepID=A0A1F6DGJ2_9BACT|nr:MAG: hypothetical protein A3C89_04205 [Candidatus Kaiserbacteria bacterium RIFCSPHIGHO2_02_FULL_50_50]OGG88635.1 MAG: hypothetical protein A3G62_00890 [Candidatus Kaiserbacteria bacterium RIFCSPLOWO2_12_FULL_50_10]
MSVISFLVIVFIAALPLVYHAFRYGATTELGVFTEDGTMIRLRWALPGVFAVWIVANLVLFFFAMVLPGDTPPDKMLHADAFLGTVFSPFLFLWSIFG